MNNYQETVQYLYDLQYSGIKLGLENITQLLSFWNSPQNKWPAIHLAGTNGKGSTAAFIFSILQASGYRVGLYTSPHLIDFSERIRVNDELISWDTIISYTNDLRPQIEKIKPTFFEATTAIAFRYFAEQQVDVAVVETGLGGRLDATNLVNPLVTVITPISLDHQQYLGSDLLQITQEKAGIIKPNVPCITNNTDLKVINILQQQCFNQTAPFYHFDLTESVQILEQSITKSIFNLRLPEVRYDELEIQMAGDYQVNNASLAIASLQQLGNLKIEEQNLRNGLKQAVWRGRLQIVNNEPLTILDVAHNPDSFRNVLQFIKKQFPQKKIWMLVGLAKDKDYRTIADIIKKHVDKVAVVDNFSDRALQIHKIMNALKANSMIVEKYNDLKEGYNNVIHRMKNSDVLLIMGSHYLAGEYLQKIQNT